MLFTHALVGLLVAAGVAVLAPGQATVAVAGGLLGGVAPDLDMVLAHRRTLHFPVAAVPVAAGAAVAVRVAPTATTAFLAAAALAAAAHAWMDVLGAGKELRPWLRTDDRAVYDHVRGRWLRARRLCYDGSRGDLALSAAVAAGCLLALPGRFAPLVAGLVAGGAAYALGRRWLARRIPDEYTRMSTYVKQVLAGAWGRAPGR